MGGMTITLWNQRRTINTSIGFLHSYQRVDLFKKQVTLRLNVDVVDYFKKLADETGIPYQNLINLYLQDCARSQKKLKLKWAS